MARGSKQARVVPLSAATIRTLKDLREITGWSSSLFPNTYCGDKYMSENANGRMQLDHSERSKVVAAYARSEHLEKRRQMMEDWGSLVDALEAGDDVVPLARAA